MKKQEAFELSLDDDMLGMCCDACVRVCGRKSLYSLSLEEVLRKLSKKLIWTPSFSGWNTDTPSPLLLLLFFFLSDLLAVRTPPLCPMWLCPSRKMRAREEEEGEGEGGG